MGAVNGRFRLRGKHLFLTYSQIPETLFKEEVLQQLRNKVSPICILSYVVKEELHQNGGKHFHVYLGLSKRYDIRAENRLDLTWESRQFHGNYQAVKDVRGVLAYCVKEENGSSYITNLELDSEGRELTLDRKLGRTFAEKGLHAALKYLFSKHQEIECSKFSGYERWLRSLARVQRSLETYKAHYSIESFEPHADIDHYIEKDKPKVSLYISGPTGLAKTSYVTAKADSVKPDNYLFVRALDHLKLYDPLRHQVIICDDVETPMSREALISLYDTQEDSAINVKHDVIQIKKHTSKIFISNTDFFDLLRQKGLDKDPALLRRVQHIKITKTLIKTPVIHTYSEHTYSETFEVQTIPPKPKPSSTKLHSEPKT